jgi:hypothetical protein
MLDISRDKVPTLQTLLRLADLFALLKINHLELYIEGFSFAYPSFTGLWQGETPLTGEEIRTLDAYCRERNIDLVPNQNCLGHMSAWIATDRYRHLVENDQALSLMGITMPPSTLNPLDPESLELVRQMTEDLLPNFSSPLFNVNMDEPFGLGTGKSKAQADKIGVGRLYVDYAKKIYALTAAQGKRMMMWGDILASHIEEAADLPRDIIVLDWGYEAEHPYPQRARALQAAGLPFCLCPGTSSWSSFMGRTDNMFGCVKAAAQAAREYGGLGLIITDWGDNGHLQYLPVSYAGYAALGAYGWQAGGAGPDEIARWLDRFVFRDTAGRAASLWLEAGRYNRFEEFPLPNMTLAALPLMAGVSGGEEGESMLNQFAAAASAMMGDAYGAAFKARLEARKALDYPGLLRFFQELREGLAAARMTCDDADLAAREFKNGLAMVEFAEGIRYYLQHEGEWDLAARRRRLQNLLDALGGIAAEHRTLWMARNKPGGFERSAGRLLRLGDQIEARLKSLA